MPDPNRPRRLPPDPNPESDFEVVDDDAPPPKPAPRPAAKPPARPAPPAAARPAPPPAARPAPNVPPKPAFEVVDDTEVEAAAKTKTAEVRKPARAVRDEDDDDDRRPRKAARAVRDDDDEDDDDRPRKKKVKKKGSQAKTADEHDQELRDRRLKEFEIIWPSVLLFLGVVLSFTGAIGAAGVNGFATIGVMVVGLVVSIPLTIAALMVVGVLCGINYGRFGPAVLKIAAITLIVNGVYFIGEWQKVPIFIVGPIGCAVAFGLFKTQFDLDNQETNTSMGALNVLSFLMKLAILFVLATVAARQERQERGSDPDDDPPPAETRRDRGKGKAQPPAPGPVMDPDDDGDDE